MTENNSFKFKAIYYLCILLVVVLIKPLKGVSAAGTTFTNTYTGQVAKAEVRAVLINEGGQETIFESLTFNLNPLTAWNFVYLIPVPNEPEVKIIPDDLFEKMDYLTETGFNKDNLWDKLLYPDIVEEKFLPQKVYSRLIDFVKIKVYKPEESLEAVITDLFNMGYVVPKNAKPILGDYHKMKWYLIAAEVNGNHLQMDATDSITVYGAHTLPLKIKFKSDKIIYPLKLASIQPDIDSQAIPFDYVYGTSSEEVMGEKNENVDILLSDISKNKFPTLPLELANLKIDLFVLDTKKVEIDGFNTGYADWIEAQKINFKDSKEDHYFELPENKYFLTRLFAYRPFLQLEDLEIKNTKDNTRVNPSISMPEKVVRISILLLVVFVFSRKFIIRSLFHK